MKENNQNGFNFFIEKINNKKIGLLFYLPAAFVALCFILFMALPIAQNKVLTSLAVKLFDLSDHNISMVLPFFYAIFIFLISLSIFPLSVSLIKSNKTAKAVNAGIGMSVGCGIIVTVFTALLALKCEDIVLDLQYSTNIKLETAGAVTAMEIGGFVSAVVYLSFGVCVLLIKKDIIKMGQKGSVPSAQEAAAAPVETVVQSEQNTLNEVKEVEKYKELLEAGVITQEEFDAKRKQLLDL